MSESAIRILVVDDHRIVREGIRSLIEEVADIQVVGEARNGLEGVNLAGTLLPDVILMDLMMPHMDGMEATKRIKEKNPDMPILVLTSFIADDKLFPAIKAGATGYLLKDTSSAELINAIRQADQGEVTMHPQIAAKVLAELRRPPAEENPPTDPLTEREVEVLKLVAKGYSNKEIAAELQISTHTARTHVNHILSKLHLANRVQAALYALREGVSSLDENLD